MAVAEELQVIINAKVASAVRDLKKVQQQTDKTDRSAKDLAKSILKKGAAFAAAGLSIRAVVKTLKESVQLYGQQIQAEQRLAAAIDATGGNSDILLDTYKDMASAIQDVTTVGDETTLMLMQQARIMGVSNNQMDEAVKGAIGLSKAFGIGTQQAIRGVANAMNGEYTTLQRYIPALRTATSESEKMEIVQKAMADGFEVAKSEAEGGFGALEQLKNASGDLKEQLGALVVEGAEPFIRSLTEFAKRTATAISETREFRNIMKELEESGETGEASIGGLEKTLEVLNERIESARAGLQGFGTTTEELEEKEKELEAAIRNGGSAAQAQYAVQLTNIRARKRAVEQAESQIQVIEEEIAAKQELLRISRLSATTEGEGALARQQKRAEIESEFATLIRQRLDLADELESKEAEIWRQYEMGYSTAEEAEKQRQQLLEKTREKAIQIASGFDEVAERARGAFAEAEIAANGFTRTAADDFISVFIRGITDELAGEDYLAPVSDSIQENMTLLDTGLIPLTREAAEMWRQYGENAVASVDGVGEAALSAAEKFSMLLSAGQNLFSSLSSLSNAYYDAEIQQAEGNERKIKKLKRDQAIAQKALGIFNASVNTAEAVTKALTGAPPPFNLVLAALSGAAGAAQIAAIAAQPIPALAKGGIVDKPTLAMIGEAGPEAVVPLGKGGMGGNVTIHVHGSMTTERETARLVTRYQELLTGDY